MPPLSLQGETLGARHQHFNKLVQEAFDDNKQIGLTKINSDESDLENLLKIEIAYKTDNVDYMVEVYKCNDMLYVSRAIKRSTRFITDQTYAHVFNPEYLYTQVFPHMLTQAINKLLLQIRLHLKDEKRVEDFYLYLKEVSNDAHKWLLNCSIPFIENVLENENNITIEFFNRLCKRSIKFLRFYKNFESQWRYLKAVSFLLRTDTEEFLNVLDEAGAFHALSGRKNTEIVMKKYPNRILDNFVRYADDVHLPTVVKYLKKEEIIDFMLKNSKDKEYFFRDDHHLKPFIEGMSEEDRFEFVKRVYIDKNEAGPDLGKLKSPSADESDRLPPCEIPIYKWYQYAPFDVALTELRKLIRAESSPAERCEMMIVLITCAKDNQQDTKTLLQHYFDKYRNEPYKFKIKFVNKVITQMATHKFDSETWNILDQLFHSLEVYVESDNDVQLCLKAIILYKVLHDEHIPEIVEKKNHFDTFRMFESKLNEEEQNKIFSYLLSSTMIRIKNKVITNEYDLENAAYLLRDAFNLFIDWKKNLKEYPLILARIPELIKIKKENSWDTDISYLYDMKKSWQKYMFKDSLTLKPTGRSCLNALKHKPQLLETHKDEVNTLKAEESVSLRRMLRKLRIYWPQSLAQQWIDDYLNDLNNSTGHEAFIQSLFVLLPQVQITNMAKKYAPDNSKIDWTEVDQTELSISKNIAKNLHIARPMTSLDVVLLYAQGDYLQYAVPSLSSLLYNISKVQSREYVPKLLDAPVSLQKHGLHFAFAKLKHEELKPIFSDIWKSTKNLTIRKVLFTYTFKLVCQEKEPSIAKEFWEILSTFIDNLTAEDNKSIFNLLGKAKKVHDCVRGQFFMKSYTFLASLPASANCEQHKKKLFNYATCIMDMIDADFVVDKILAPVEEKLSQPRSEYIDIMSSYVLYGKTEEEQCERFRKILVPALEYALKSWNSVNDDEYVVKENVDNLLKALTFNMKKYLIAKTITVPVKLFSEVKMFIERNLPIEENYVRYTSWKLITEYVTLVAEYKDIIFDSKLDKICLTEIRHNWLPLEYEAVWEELHIKLSPQLGTIIVKHLKEDTEKYFLTISWMFGNAFRKMIDYLSFRSTLMEMETMKYMILEDDFIPSYLIVCEETPKYSGLYDQSKRREIRDILSAHPSLEVKMHYHRAFAELPDIVIEKDSSPDNDNMLPSAQQEDTLGEKHQHFNKLVQEVFDDNKQIVLTEINSDESDLENLLKIEIASKTDNVGYMVEVYKCNDMLYVSRAIKRSTRFITDQTYAHVFNPEYLYTQVFPDMLTQAINKLLLQIRLHLKDEKRVEDFYLYLKEVSSDAQKWLLNCSIPFIETALENGTTITLELFKRLCKRSVKFLRFHTKVEGRNRWCSLKSVSFLLKTETEEFLNVLDEAETYSPLNGKKNTEMFMKKYPKRILDNFGKYADSVDLPTVVKYLKKEEIEDFMLKNCKNMECFFSDHEKLKHFIKGMPEQDRFEFVRKVYIDKNEAVPKSHSPDESDCLPPCSIPKYQWYQYAPFDVALTELRKIIQAESSPAERCEMMIVLMMCARDNKHDTRTLLQYYFDKHRNEPFKFKIEFVNNVIAQMATHKFDSETWNILDKLFHSLEVYVESDNDVQLCLKAIILYKVLHNENIPEIVEEKNHFDTFRMFESKLNAEEQNKIFSYLLSSTITKIQNKIITNAYDLENAAYLLRDAFDLFMDWEKDLKMYPFILAKIPDLIKIKKENSWDTDISYLYDMKKSWQKYMFKDSLMLKPTGRSCLNALKHNPQLLESHKDEVNMLKADSVSLRPLLRKLRIYWPQSLAKQWTDDYLKEIKNSTWNEPLIRSLFVLLPQVQITNMAKKYAPDNSKIDWTEVDQTKLSISKNIAKNLHIARPMTSLDVVLLYAQGDYLQYAVPSLSSLLYNISKAQSREYVPKLLDAPVSLQKHGLHFAFAKLKHEELKPIFSDIWKSTKNLTIRKVLFTYTFKLVCQEKEPSIAKEFWDVLSTFIDNLTAEDNKYIFNLLGKAKKVHDCVRGQFFMKSYTFLASLPASANCEQHKKKLFNYATCIMEMLDADFVVDKFLAPVEEKLSQPRSEYIDIMSSYVLYGKTEDEQCERFRKILVPALECALKSWNLVKGNVYVVKENVDNLLRALTFDMKKYLIAKTINVPVKLFSEIKMFIEQNLRIEENYVRYTSWKLITEYVTLVAEYKDIIFDSKLDKICLTEIRHNWLPLEYEAVWEELHIKLSPQLGTIIVKHLKEDTEKYFLTISWMFGNAFRKMIDYLSFRSLLMEMETMKYMVLDEDFIPSYLIVCEAIPKYTMMDDNDKNKRKEIRHILSAHPSPEVQMHYQKAFAELPDVVLEKDSSNDK